MTTNWIKRGLTENDATAYYQKHYGANPHGIVEARNKWRDSGWSQQAPEQLAGQMPGDVAGPPAAAAPPGVANRTITGAQQGGIAGAIKGFMNMAPQPTSQPGVANRTITGAQQLAQGDVPAAAQGPGPQMATPPTPQPIGPPPSSGEDEDLLGGGKPWGASALRPMTPTPPAPTALAKTSAFHLTRALFGTVKR